MNLTLISSAIAAAIAFSAAWQLQSARLSDLRTEYATAQFQALEKAHAQTIALQAKADTAAKQHAARASTLANAAALSSGAADSLRNDLAAALLMSNTQFPASNHETVSELLAQCGKSFADMAAEADKRSSEVILLLDAWPK